MKRLSGILIGFGVLALAQGAAAQGAPGQALTGDVAAFIDWGVRNCEAKSTDSEHKLVEEVMANEKSKDAFQKAYLKQFQAKMLTDATASGAATQAMCKLIKEWYGPHGTKASDLIYWPRANGPSESPSALTAQQAGAYKTGAGKGPTGH